MKGFYVLLAAVAVISGGVIWYGSRGTPAAAPAASALPPLPATDGFRGFTLGADAAPIEVTEYSDFECPYCASFATVQMPVIREQLIATGKARWRYRDFPLPTHQYSRYAALAAQCAGEQGKFWEMHDQLFSNHQWAQTGKNPRSLFRDFAKSAGLDLDKYDACIDGQRYAGRIQASLQEGEALGIGGTDVLRERQAVRRTPHLRRVQGPGRQPGETNETAEVIRRRQAIVVLALVGLLVATYLWLYKIGVIGVLQCGTGSCEAVQTSRYAVVFGVPVALVGVAGYAVLVAVGLVGLQPALAADRRITVA